MATGVPPETKHTELGASVSITIIIDIGRPRAVVRQRRIPKLPDKTPESSLMTAPRELSKLAQHPFCQALVR
jgi:hypothetical protein